MTSDEEYKRIRGLSNEELKVELGRAIVKQRGGLPARPPSVKKLIDEANAWIAAKNEELLNAICTNEQVRNIVESDAGATEKLVRVVADVVSALIIMVPAGTVAEILVRDGIPEYCDAIWKSKT